MHGTQYFIKVFSFQWHQACKPSLALTVILSNSLSYCQAPGEAEVELVNINKLDLIDAVLTDNGEIYYLEPGTNVKEDADITDVYQSSRVMHDANLMCSDMILIMLLSECDYDEVSLWSYRSHIARGLVCYGLGHALYMAACAYDDTTMTTFFADWHEMFRVKLRNDLNNFIKHHYSALADALPESFSNIATLQAYICPIVSLLQHDMTLVTLNHINPAQLGILCELYFTWGTRPQILQWLHDLLWVGMAVQTLIAEVLFCKQGSQNLMSSDTAPHCI